MSADVRRLFLGFAGGVMIAASVWSLLIPAIEMAEEQGKIGWIPAAGGFVLGGIFLLLLDRLLPHLHLESKTPEGLQSSWKRTTLLVLAVTLHNIPEGLAVGLTFGMAAQGNSTVTIASAIVLAVGIGLQNFPEGAAISLPLRQEGLSRTKAFLYGAASGIVEPIAGVAGVLLVGSIVGIMPWLLAMAAGAMIYVVVEELIPEACLGEHSHKGTFGVMLGFLVMMILDVALG
jgi:ZIP family zinc transporter